MSSLLTMLWLALADPAPAEAPARRRLAFRRSPQRPVRRRLELEHLEGRNLLSGLMPGGLKLGPLVQVTTGVPGSSLSDEVEPYLAVNPANPKNMVGTWTQDAFPGAGSTNSKAIGVAVTFNGGNSWRTGVIPGITLFTGGDYKGAADSWLSFAPNGDLYFSCMGISSRITNGNIFLEPTAILFEKSTDGGLTWSTPITLVQSDRAAVFNDKDSITADPTTSGYAYVVWARLTQSGGPAMLTRTTDGGQTWSTPSTIFDPGGGTNAEGNILVVSPDGTLNDFMDVGRFQNTKKIQTLSLVRSPDKGQTWLPSDNPIQVANMLSIGVTDPDTGQPVNAANGLFSVAVDPHNGYLYTVWTDARFGNSQYDSVAFSMSKDGGFTWSAPIQVNQTPASIPTGNRQAFLPSIAVAADGSVAVTYYDFRFNDASPGLRTDYWLVAARAGTDLTNPASWCMEARLTNASFDLEKAGIWAGAGYFVGDYQGFAAAGNSFNAFFAMPNGDDPADIYCRDPPFEDASTSAPVLMNEATVADPGALLLGEASWNGLAVDAFFMHLAGTSQTPDSGRSLTVGLEPRSTLGATDPIVPRLARLSGAPIASLARRVAQAPADDWGTDVLTLADRPWDVESATWPAG